jgi:hypothetical protein
MERDNGYVTLAQFLALGEEGDGKTSTSCGNAKSKTALLLQQMKWDVGSFLLKSFPKTKIQQIQQQQDQSAGLPPSSLERKKQS